MEVDLDTAVNRFVTYLSQMSEEDRFNLLSKQYERYIVGEGKISREGLEMLLTSLWINYMKTNDWTISQDLNTILNFLFQKIESHPNYSSSSSYPKLLPADYYAKFDWAFVYNIPNYASNAPIRPSNEIASWNSTSFNDLSNTSSSSSQSRHKSRGSYDLDIEKEPEERTHENNPRARQSIEITNHNTHETNPKARESVEVINFNTHETNPKARESVEIINFNTHVTNPRARESREIINVNTHENNPKARQSVEIINRNQDLIHGEDETSSSFTNSGGSNVAVGGKTRKPRDTMELDVNQLIKNGTGSETPEHYDNENITNTDLSQREDTQETGIHSILENPTGHIIITNEQYEELLKEWRETTSRLKEITLQLSDFEDGVMREITQMNDGVNVTATQSTESLKYVRRIHDKQEQYHQEEIMRLGTEVTNKMAQTLMLAGNGADSPLSQSSHVNEGFNNISYGIGPRSLSLKGSTATNEGRVSKHVESSSDQYVTRKRNLSATLAAATNQMYEYKDYTDVVENSIQTVKTDSKSADDPDRQTANLDTVREDDEARHSESDESISSQEQESRRRSSVRIKRRQYNKDTTKTKDNTTESLLSTPTVTFSGVNSPAGNVTTNNGASPNVQLVDLQQSMDELLRHLKQPSTINFQKILEKGLNQSPDTKTRLPATPEKEDENQHGAILAKKKSEELKKEIEMLQKQVVVMENTQQTLETNLKYKEAIIQEQKVAIQNEKDLRGAVQEWKGDLLKEIGTLLSSTQSQDKQSSWEDDSFKAIGALEFGQNEILDKLNQILAIEKRSQGNSGNASESSLTNSQMQQLTELTTKLTQDVGAVSMLSVLREEYKVMREERDTLKRQVDQFRKHNSELLTRVNHLEEEGIYLRESKRATVKSIVDEMNEMRDKIASLSHILKSQTLPSQ